MDSILTNIVNAPQMSAVDFVNFADGGSWVAATYKRVVFIPANARVSGFGIMVGVDTGGDTGTNTITIGHEAGVLQADVGMTNAVATADVDAYAKAVNLQTVGFTGPSGVNSAGAAAVTAGAELMCKPPTMTSSASYSYAPSKTAIWSSSGEKVIPVVGYVTTGQTQVTGNCHWWVNYVFDANIVWDQASL